MEKMIKIEIDLSKNQAEALAQFVKRVGIEDLKHLAFNEDEAYLMLDAILRIQTELSEKGFAPR